MSYIKLLQRISITLINNQIQHYYQNFASIINLSIHQETHLNSNRIEDYKESMGHCVSRRQIKKPGQFNWKELHHLQCMFQDLASRSKNGTITKQIFKCFFHLNGLWGEEIFRKFDKNNRGELDFVQFCSGLDMLVKGSYKRQIYYLFQFYVTAESDGIKYDELLKMFYSYSKEELMNLVNDDNFLKTMNESKRKYLFGNKECLDPLREVIEESSSSGQDQVQRVKKIEPRRRMTDNGKLIRKFTSQQLIPQPLIQTSNSNCNFKNTKQSNKQNIVQSTKNSHITSPDKLNATNKQNNVQDFPPRRRGTMCYLNVKKTEIKTIPTISLLAKKYATYLFRQFKLDKQKDSLTYQQFQELVTRHEKLFMSYFGGFHQYIWEVPENNMPSYLKMTCWIQGPCVVYDLKKQNSNKRYVKFYKTTLFVLRTKDDTLPDFIVNLEGLLVLKYQKGKQYGFLVQHRDGVYPERSYLFSNASIQEEWLFHLQSYMHNNSIHESYNILDRVGSGNYSIVYKGMNKNTKSQVAIKVIQKFKFSMVQKEIIKQECGFLELAIHPSIVNFIQQVETKTHLYVITQYMDDGDLLDYVKKKQFLDEYEAAVIMSQLFSATEYLNSLSIIHRDLKCENIMIKLNKQKKIVDKVKIIDFGFAVYKDVLQKLPEKQRYVGTPNYVAPQILKNQKFNQKVDMFSLGVIMYYILSGSLPFDSLFMDEIGQATTNCSYEMDGRCWDTVSEEAKDLIKNILCEQDKRISIHQAIKHPWLKDKQQLKSATKRGRGPKYI